MTTNENIQYRSDRRKLVRVDTSLWQIIAFVLGVGLLSTLGGVWVTAQFLSVHKVDKHPGSASLDEVARNQKRLDSIDAKILKLGNVEPKVSEVQASIVTVQQALKLQSQTVNDSLLSQREQLVSVVRRLERIEELLREENLK